ncbi:MAG: hypothetical protein WCB85_09160 [Candidatus Dormiibacterota bacterium]
MRVHDSHLWAATDSRLFRLRLEELEVVQDWERGLVRYASQIEVADERVVLANWLSPSVAILDTASGRLRRVRVGSQPVLFQHGGRVRVISGLEGGMQTLDPARACLVDATPTPPICSVGVGRDLWGVVAGNAETPRAGRSVPSNVALPRFRRGSDHIVRLTGEPMSVRLPGRCSRIWCDDGRNVLWCFVEGPVPPGAVISGYAVSQRSGRVVAEFHTENATTLLQRDPELGVVPVHLVHLDPELGNVLTVQDYSRRMRGNQVVSSTSTLACYSLPAL